MQLRARSLNLMLVVDGRTRRKRSLAVYRIVSVSVIETMTARWTVLRECGSLCEVVVGADWMILAAWTRTSDWARERGIITAKVALQSALYGTTLSGRG